MFFLSTLQPTKSAYEKPKSYYAEMIVPQEMEQKTVELAYFLRVPIEPLT